MTADRWILGLCAVWLVLAVAGRAHATVGTPTGGGFGRGFNLLSASLVREGAALLSWIAILVV